MRSWMQQVLKLRRDFGIEIIWVTSGAIASAIERTSMRERKGTLAEKQALSAIGQPLLMDLYNLSLQSVGLLGAQVLLTYGDLVNRARLGNFKNTIEMLLKWKIVPILNENDAVATEEIKFGDNDSLSAMVAVAIGADRLVIMTDVEGLFDSDPKKNTDARRVSNLTGVPKKVLRQVQRSPGSRHGTGGMYSKLRAASLATRNKIETWLVKGDDPSVLLKIAENADVGTRIVPHD